MLKVRRARQQHQGQRASRLRCQNDLEVADALSWSCPSFLNCSSTSARGWIDLEFFNSAREIGAPIGGAAFHFNDAVRQGREKPLANFISILI